MDGQSDRLTRLEERCRGNTRRIEALENLAGVLHEQNTHIAELVNELKHTNEHIFNHEERLERLEAEPNQRYKEAVRAVLTAVVSAIVGGVLGAILRASGIF